MPLALPAAAALGITCRPEQASDLPFIAALYASTRTDEIAGFDWPPETVRAFLDQQHLAQHRHYGVVYPAAERLIVEQSNPIGRLYYEERPQSVHLIDLSLVPERRGAGFGGALLADLIRHSETLGKATSLQVEKGNGARRLYERLGFATITDNGLYDVMERPPG